MHSILFHRLISLIIRFESDAFSVKKRNDVLKCTSFTIGLSIKFYISFKRKLTFMSYRKSMLLNNARMSMISTGLYWRIRSLSVALELIKLCHATWSGSRHHGFWKWSKNRSEPLFVHFQRFHVIFKWKSKKLRNNYFEELEMVSLKVIP